MAPSLVPSTNLQPNTRNIFPGSPHIASSAVTRSGAYYTVNLAIMLSMYQDNMQYCVVNSPKWDLHALQLL